MVRFSYFALVLTLAFALRPTPAEACGGLVCSMAAPVIQDAEQIIFSDNGDGTITAIIQIQYSGDAERFAWVLPVPGTPEIAVSSDLAFQRLREQTDPTYRLERSIEGTCGTPPAPPTSDRASDVGISLGSGGSGGGPPPVTVVDSGSVGPYDYVTISLEPEADNPGDVAITFLREGGYDVDDTTRDVLGPYLADGMNLIAFRLTKSATSGNIRPIVMTYESASAMIPIRPTGLAASDDMGIRVWVMGEHRAVPANYRHVILNDARYNWFGGDYMRWVSDAVDEAGGRAFVTELAAPAETVMPIVFSSRDEFTDSGAEGFDLIRNVIDQYFILEDGGLRLADGLVEVITSHVELPAGLTALLYVQRVKNGVRYELPPGFDRDAFLASLETNVIMPLRMTQEILDRRPYLTRMVTTMSPAEMTMDPNFVLNADLPDVSGSHVATQVLACSESFYLRQAPWTIALPGDLGEVRGQFDWPHTAASGMPAARRIEQLGPSGPEMVIDDRTPMIQSRIRYSSSVFRPEIPSNPADDALAGGACSASGSPSSLAWLLLGLVLIRRRAL